VPELVVGDLVAALKRAVPRPLSNQHLIQSLYPEYTENMESVVSITGPQVSSCGYCKSKPDASHSNGIWAHFLTPESYQNLIDRGWRRSGAYIYKPNLRDSCCQCYTIRLDSALFTISKGQKKVLKKMKKCLTSNADIS
jgi:arginyl-tRNA---protein transferase